MRRAPILLYLLLATHASAQAVTLGAQISLDGVHVSGFALEGEPRAGRRVQSTRSVRIAVYAGRPHRAPDETRATLHVCGVDAVRSEVSFPAPPPGRIGAEGSAHVDVPPRMGRTYVRVEILRVVDGRDRAVTIEWSVVTAQREALRSLETAFFESIQCDSAAGV
jgi:hypothetical protein